VRLRGVIFVEALSLEEPRIGEVGLEDGGDRQAILETVSVARYDDHHHVPVPVTA
jgi:hypothetical protein